MLRVNLGEIWGLNTKCKKLDRVSKCIYKQVLRTYANCGSDYEDRNVIV